MTTAVPLRFPPVADGTIYIVNTTFDGGVTGEFIKADPSLVADWIEAGFISEVDDRGDRIIRGDTLDGAPGIVPGARVVSAADDDDR